MIDERVEVTMPVETTLERNKTLVRELVERVYGGELARLGEIVSARYVDHSRWKTREGLKKMLEGFLAAYSRVEFSLEDVLAESDRVAVRIHCECRSQGNTVEKTIDSTGIFRVYGGKVVEHWGNSDSLI